jgi:ABC-type bacteriocin/lantibiotic exporter with double-glycine peptidase domain
LSKLLPAPPPAALVQPIEYSNLSALVFVLECRGAQFDPELLGPATGGAFAAAEMLAVARAHGCEAWQHTCVWEHLVAVPFPALAELRDGRFLLVGAFAGDRILLQDPRHLTSATVLYREEFVAHWSGRLVLLATPGWKGTVLNSPQDSVRVVEATAFAGIGVASIASTPVSVASPLDKDPGIPA